MPKLGNTNSQKIPPTKTLASPSPSSAPKPSNSGEGLKPEQSPSSSPVSGKGKKPKPVRESREILYPRIETRVFCSDPEKAPLGKNGQPAPAKFTAAIGKEILGWQTEEDFAEALKSQYTAAELKNINKTFGEEYLLKDRKGRKIRCGNNLHNRPFYSNNAEDWMLEILRRKWELNGESMIVDKYGGCQDIQHRVAGLILAAQEWAEDKLRPKPEQQWQELWQEEPYLDCIIVFGIEDTDKVVNTINTGKVRTLADALYRSSWLADKTKAEKERLSNIMSRAVTFLWNRTEAKKQSLAPRRPHSESFEFIDSHKRLIDCVKFISEEGEGKKLTSFLPLGYASALLYLMGCARSDVFKYHKTGNEKALDWSLKDKAEEFWTLFCAKAASMEPLYEELERIPLGCNNVTFPVAIFIKAWNLFSDKRKLTQEELTIAIDVEDNNFVLGEPMPRIGGIDVDPEEDLGLPPEGESVDDMAARGICPKTKAPHNYVTEDGETFCKNCLDPKA
jgi:hypothetical protein